MPGARRGRMASIALRGAALLLAGLFVSSTADAQAVWDPSSKRYGKTIVSVPSVYYAVSVAADGKVTPLSGSKITVAHEETGAGCRKVSSVSAAFATTAGFSAAPKPDVAYPNACTFTASSASFNVAFPLGPLTSVPAEMNALRLACRNRAAGVSKVLVPHPLLTGLQVSLSYGSAGEDRVRYPAPPISIACEPCAASSFVKKDVSLQADKVQSFDLATLVTGGVAPLTFKVTPPPGMQLQGSVITGRPTAGSYVRRVEVTGTCATGAAVAAEDVTFVAKGILVPTAPPKVKPPTAPNPFVPKG